MEGRRLSIWRSAPEMSGPARSRQRQGCPSSRTAEQQSSLGGDGLKGATAALHGIMSCSSAPRWIRRRKTPSARANLPINQRRGQVDTAASRDLLEAEAASSKLRKEAVAVRAGPSQPWAMAELGARHCRCPVQLSPPMSPQMEPR